MEYNEAKEKFIQAWGALGTNWGINRTMAQIHALLLISDEALTTDEIREELGISGGNANMNIRGLIDWGIVKRELKKGERREYFSAGKDIWELARQLSRERRKREIEPVLGVLSELGEVTGGDRKKTTEFKKVINELEEFTRKADGMLEKFIKSDESWFYKTLLRMMK